MENCFPVSSPTVAFILASSSSDWPTFNCASFHSKVVSTEPLSALLPRVTLCPGLFCFEFSFKRLHVKQEKTTLFLCFLAASSSYCFQQHLGHTHTSLCRWIVLLVTLPLGVFSLLFVGALFKLLNLPSAAGCEVSATVNENVNVAVNVKVASFVL